MFSLTCKPTTVQFISIEKTTEVSTPFVRPNKTRKAALDHIIMAMASPSRPPEENLRTFLVTNLREIMRELENFPLVEHAVIDYALYRLEQVVLMSIECQRTWPNAIDDTALDLILRVYWDLDHHVLNHHSFENFRFPQFERNTPLICYYLTCVLLCRGE